MAQVDPEVAVESVPMATRVHETQRSLRFLSAVFLLATALAMALAAFGVFAILAEIAGSQRGVIALRMALGASEAAIVRSVVWRGIRVSLAGTAMGIALSYPFCRLLSGQLFQTTADDAVPRVATFCILSVTACLAGWLPARRASRANPSDLLRT